METCKSGSVGDQWKRTRRLYLASGLPNFAQRGNRRACKHTDLALVLLQGSAPEEIGAAGAPASASGAPPVEHPLVAATRHQWAGLAGTWSIEERDLRVWNERDHFVLLRLLTRSEERRVGKECR